MSQPLTIWAVWTESGEYESWAHDTQAIFATEALAQQHAEQLRSFRQDWEVGVHRQTVMDELPILGTWHRREAHILADGAVDRPESGWISFPSWQYADDITECRISTWNRRDPDLSIDITGHDKEAIKALYTEMLQEARDHLAGRRQAYLSNDPLTPEKRAELAAEPR